VFIGHGAFEHCQVYSKLASRLNDCNMLVFSHDHGMLSLNIAINGFTRFILPDATETVAHGGQTGLRV